MTRLLLLPIALAGLLAPHQTARIEHAEVLTQYLHIDNTEWEYGENDRVRPSGGEVDGATGSYRAVTTNTTGQAEPRVVTAYTSYPEQTDSTPCIGAWGDDLCRMFAEGTRPCASNAFVRGTLVSIEGYGTCTVLDRMNSRYPDRVDIYMGYDTPTAMQWGIRTVNVKEI